jgi:hypothetical protein
MDCNLDVQFNITNSLASTLGFEKYLHSSSTHNLLTLKSLGNIQYEINDNNKNINSIKVICNIAKGSFENGQHSNSTNFFHKYQKLA